MKFHGYFEVCEMPEDKRAARTKIKMSALRISENDDDNNGNGINWVKEYVEDNIDSLIGAPYKARFIDDDKTIPSDHGSMVYDDDGNLTFPDSDTVGTIMDAEIQTVTIDDKEQELLITQGYLFNQSYPNFVEWLKTESNQGTIYGSIELNGKGDSKKIVYLNDSGFDDDGNPINGRKPQIFDFTALAILSNFVEPADYGSRIFELNSAKNGGEQMTKQKRENNKSSVKTSKIVEINELSYDDISCLICRAFNRIMESDGEDYRYYSIYKLYPQSNRVVMCYWDTPMIYYMTNYTIQNNSVTLGDITKVDEEWKPVNGENAVEINTIEINRRIKEEMGIKMDNDKAIMELNQKVEDKTNEINELNNKLIEANNKNAELNESIVNANRTVEELNEKVESLTVELNTCKEERDSLKADKEAAEQEQKKAEVNSYYENEISKNGFSDEELNSLKSYVENVDLDGLKSAEAEICAKKFKEMNLKPNEEGTEINSKSSTFITIHEKPKKEIKDKNKIPSFFSE